ncbi:alkaline-phosphatase-like protein [Dipodascopsis uninucleata]
MRLDIWTVGLTIWISLLHVIASILFGAGFLLRRAAIPDIANEIAENDVLHTFDRPFKHAIIIVIDALRFDFIGGVDNEGIYGKYTEIFRTPYTLVSTMPENAAILRFVADPPTTTLQRLKALTTGSLPTFVEAGMNFGGGVTEEDSWIDQALRAGKRIAFTGDETWTALYPSLLDNFGSNTSAFVRPYESFNVWDLDTVDRAVEIDVSEALTHPSDWDILIGHMLGIDHAGHRFGPDTVPMNEKLAEMNIFIQNITSAIKGDEDTILFVLGDHGMDSKGDHGGDSAAETEAALFIYSSRSFIQKKPSGTQFETIDQIDFVPTFSLLMGLPIPFSNLGAPISSVFPTDRTLASARQIVGEQIANYREKQPQFSDNSIEMLLHLARKKWAEGNTLEAGEIYSIFQRTNLLACRARWATFDLTLMALGVIVFIFAVIASFAAYIGTVNPFALGAGSIAGLFIGIIWSFCGGPHVAVTTLFSASIGSVIAYTGAIVYNTRQSFSNISGPFVALLLALVHGILLASNSFVVWESHTISFFLASIGAVLAILAMRVQDKRSKTIALAQVVAFLALVRLAEYPRMCREEQADACVSTFYASEGSTNSSDISLIILYIIAITLPSVIRAFLKMSASDEGSAGPWIEFGLRSLLLLSAAHWTLDKQISNLGMDDKAMADGLRSGRLALAGLVGIVAAFIVPVVWNRAPPLCVRVEVRQKPVAVEIYGYANANGSLYLMIELAFFLLATVCSKPVGGISLAAMQYQVLALLELFDAIGVNENTIAIVPAVFGMLAQLHFFATGHQNTLVSLQWDSAFVFTDTPKFPLAHAGFLFNTFGPFIIAASSTSLVALYKTSPADYIVDRIRKAALGLMIYTGGIAGMSAIAAFVLRRHLMMWKIFAPRFVFAVATCLVVDVVIVITSLAGLRAANIVRRVFGRIRPTV